MARWTNKGIRTIKSRTAAVRGLFLVGLMALSLVSGLASTAFGFYHTPPGPVAAPTFLTLPNLSAFESSTFTATATLYAGVTACSTITGEPIEFTLFGTPQVVMVGYTQGGVASVSFTAPATPGTFAIQADFLGTPSCAAVHVFATLSVVASSNASLTTLTLGNANAFGGALFTVTAKLKPGSCGANQGLSFTFPVQNSQVIKTTASNGVAAANFIAPVSPGTYPITVTYNGSPYPSPGCLPSTETAQVTVLAPMSTTLSVPNVGVQAGGFFTVTATLTPPSCALGQSVTFLFNTQAKTTLANLSGMAKAVFLAPLSAEILPVQVFFNGTSSCAASSNSATVTVRGTSGGTGL